MDNDFNLCSSIQYSICREKSTTQDLNSNATTKIEYPCTALFNEKDPLHEVESFYPNGRGLKRKFCHAIAYFRLHKHY